ncbi:ATPase family AAA domain-containing protein 2-like isoform X2 [Homarus americanus]|uniref:ATPase family AAA domain-containing protein 2-like isoform X2 n=1 Tax=Homarus americanus TaxID=6706 RepID=UPI001C45FA56|nr:ATPase family AAA domain-containing protein 2-like isoform X2 [Homarus americanus]
MVSTRGNPVSENERKSALPSRESRRTTRGALQEPEDELFWDSDEQPARIHRRTGSVNVSFKEATSPRSATSRSPGSPKDDPGLMAKDGSQDCSLIALESSEESEKDSPRGRPSRIRQDEVVAVEADTDTDDEIYRRSQSRRTRGQRTKDNKNPIKKEFVMNGDDLGDHNHIEEDEGPRRSSRRRKFSSFNDQSWLVGNKKLRGYPSIVPSSEPENEEPRPSRKLCNSRYIDKEVEPRRRKLRRYDEAEDQDFCPLTPKSHRPTRRRRVPPRRYRDDPDNSEEEDVARRMRTRCGNQLKSKPKLDGEDNEEDIEEIETDGETLDRSEQHSKSFKEDQEETQDEDREEGNDGDDDEDDDDDDEELPQKRRTTRSTLVAAGEKIEDSEEEEEEESPVMRRRVIKRIRDPIAANALSVKSPFEDMYSRVKRQRRPVKRFMYEDEVPARRSRKHDSSSNDSGNDKDDEDDDDDEDDEEEEDGDEVQTRSRYSLRRNRQEIRPFQHTATVTEESSRARGYHEDSPPRRHRRNHKRYLNSPARKHMFHHKRMAAHHTSTSNSSSSDEDRFEERKARSMAKSRNRCLPMNLSPEDLLTTTLKERAKIGSSLADIDPMTLDRSVTFDAVGGLSHHVNALKEMIIFPLLYPEVFERFNIAPPRGVLFYGPPGTGKTLMARALANECGVGGKKVAFFMRKGADCLSKWVGESERQLRLLFDQAYQLRPSIIFFDEIDGLAPVRSSRQDQIHSSIVSTLLALMDGLDSRGEVVVIGATNRIDAIDPALRRPGRFDREFSFPLPSMKARLQILTIHTKSWDPLPSKRVLQYLAEQTVGYCGADLKSLCAESALIALKSKYPQIYSSKQKLLIDVSTINIKLCHFRVAMKKLVASGQRSAASVGRRLSPIVQPLLQSSLNRALRLLAESFPQAFSKFPSNMKRNTTHRPRLLLTGLRTQGQSTHLAPAIIHSLERVPTHKLDLAALYSVSARAPEEACAQMFHEARRSLPSIIYVPHIEQWWGTTSETLRATFMSLLLDMDPSSPLLLLATSDVPYDELDSDVQMLFSVYREEMMTVSNPLEAERRQFFKTIFYTDMLAKQKVRSNKKTLEELPIAPEPEHWKVNSKEMKRLEELEEATLRELRIFLREICAKLARNRTFYIFTKPVDEEEVPDYRDIIKEPMDLETMMTKIDQHEYDCAQEFLRDIDLICKNALEYNPDRNPEDKIIRHRACTLRDTAYAYIKAEMDTDFEDKCREIRDRRQERYKSTTKPSAPEFIHVAQETKRQETPVKQIRGATVTPQATSIRQETIDQHAKTTGDIHRRRKRRLRNAWARGEIKVQKRRRIIEKDSPEKKELGLQSPEIKRDEEVVEEENKITLEEVEEKQAVDGEKSEDDVSVHSTYNSEEKEGNLEKSSLDKIHNADEVHVDSEVVLYNGHLSTEDSHDSMKVTSAADELAAHSSTSSTIKESRDSIKENKDDKIRDNIMEAEDSVVSSSEQGSGSAPTECNGITIDWSHLEAVYESCISATEDSTVDELLRLHTAISLLIHKHIKNTSRLHLLQDAEAEIRRFTQFHKKS